MKTEPIQDSANFVDGRLAGVFHYEGRPPCIYDLREINPLDPKCGYWTATAGVCRGFEVVTGSTCIATVQEMLEISFQVRQTGWDEPVYVIWQPKNPTAATWARWEKKWSQRTRAALVA